MPDAHGAIVRLWLGAAIPLGVICCGLLRARLGVRVQDLQTAFFAVVAAILFCCTMLSSARDMPSIFWGSAVAPLAFS